MNIESPDYDDPNFPFGCCPECGRYDGYLNIGKENWFYCSKHKKKWRFGINMLSSWRYETEESQTAKLKRLDFDSYEDCFGEYVFPPSTSLSDAFMEVSVND